MTSVVIEEIPDKVTLAVEISNCQGSCIGCHSPFLKEDIGEVLTPEILDSLIADNFGINCFLFLGEGRDRNSLLDLARYLRGRYPVLEIGVYSGRSAVEEEYFDIFDYVKVGPFKSEFGPLNKPTTNQRMYYHREDITSRFWRR